MCDLQRATTLNLACWLSEDLNPPRVVQQLGSPDSFKVDGTIALTGGIAQCTILVPSTWIQYPPSVVCHEPWLRLGADWHTSSSDRSLCYVFNQEWRDRLGSISTSRDVLVAARVAHFWILRNVRWLLNKHLLADQLGLMEWPKLWKFWPHVYEQALRQYLAEQRVRK